MLLVGEGVRGGGGRLTASSYRIFYKYFFYLGLQNHACMNLRDEPVDGLLGPSHCVKCHVAAEYPKSSIGRPFTKLHGTLG